MELYQYERLPQPSDQLGSIRLVNLKPGRLGDEIHIEIQLHRLAAVEEDPQSPGASEESIDWHALSYTWGDTQAVDKIFVDVSSVPHEGDSVREQVARYRFLEVGKNLLEALQHLRYANKDRKLWIDAICIDQGTDQAALHERAGQVKLMYHIYSRAAGVVVWLGEEANDSTYAFSLLDNLGSSVTVDWLTFSITTPIGEPTEAMKQWLSNRHTSREYKALIALIYRTWFERVWIKQEILLAKPNNTVLICGSSYIALEVFRKALHVLSIIGLDSRDAGTYQHLNRFASVTALGQRTYMDEPNLMLRTRDSKCSDQRDRVYGNLGIMKLNGRGSFATSITVDYSPQNTPKHVFLDFFRRYVDRYDTLRLLDDAGLCQGSEMRPTWLPDWTKSYFKLDLTMESAASHCVVAECIFHQNNVLEVSGRTAVEVTDTYVLRSDNAHEESLDWFQEILILIRRYRELANDEVAIERFTRALWNPANAFRTSLDVIQERRETATGFVRYLFAISSYPGAQLEHHLALLPEPATLMLWMSVRSLKQSGLPFILSGDGYVGVGPRGAKKGDVVAVVLGSRSLMLLRPTENGQHQVVGPCSVHDLNWGEGLLGPLPDHNTVIQHMEPSRGNYVPHYLDTKTGSSTMWDPRIVWDELAAHSPMVNFIPVTAPPGEPFRVRPGSEYLQKHGVELQKFLLV